MAKVVFTANLLRYNGGVREAEVAGARVRDLLDALEKEMPGLRHYLVDDHGALRRHVNVFVDGKAVRDPEGLTDEIGPDATVHILQAISGG